jgi:methionine-rich copper-binding protein CopC
MRMMGRRLVLAALASVAGRSGAAGERLKVVETMPANDATIGQTSADFYVRFNQPVDHIRSLLTVKQNNAVVETLQPRLKSTPNVLYARAPALGPGKYTFNWTVRTIDGQDTLEGAVAFSIAR